MMRDAEKLPFCGFDRKNRCSSFLTAKKLATCASTPPMAAGSFPTRIPRRAGVDAVGSAFRECRGRCFRGGCRVRVWESWGVGDHHTTTMGADRERRPSRRNSIGSRPLQPDLYASMTTPQKQKLGRRYRKAVRVVPRMLALVVFLYALGLAAYFGKYRVRPRHHHAPDLLAVLREGEIETSSARRLLCSAAPLRVGDGHELGVLSSPGETTLKQRADTDHHGDNTANAVDGVDGGAATTRSSKNANANERSTHSRAVPRGQFIGPTKAFTVPNDRAAFLNASDARVFLLTGISASSPGAVDLLDHFLNHYLHVLKVPAPYVLAVVHTTGTAFDASVTRNIQKRLQDRHIFHETYQGEALLFSAVAHHWEHSLAAFADDADWVVAVDLDEVRPDGAFPNPAECLLHLCDVHQPLK
jgi:hypothetical protein